MEVAYSAHGILRYYGEHNGRSYGEQSGEQQIPEDAFQILAGFRAQPFVLRVRQGTELEIANTLSQDRRVASAIPNFIVRSMSTFDISDKAIDSLKIPILKELGLPPSRIALIDTGIEPSKLRGNLNLLTTQYDVDSPGLSSRDTRDSEGHGTTVARIVEQIAPNSTVLSIKALSNGTGTLAGVIIAIQIALSTFKPHVVNLSLGIDGTSEYCLQCGYPTGQQFPEAQLHRFFEALDMNPLIERPAYIAAAGNSNAITLPARCSTTIAVGSFDAQGNARSDYAEYPQVPIDRFIMAEGGSDCSSFGLGWKSERFYGTSFSAAIISAVAAGFGAAHNCSLTMRDCVLRHLPSIADKNFPGYNPALHGLGVIRSS